MISRLCDENRMHMGCRVGAWPDFGGRHADPEPNPSLCAQKSSKSRLNLRNEDKETTAPGPLRQLWHMSKWKDDKTGLNQAKFNKIEPYPTKMIPEISNHSQYDRMKQNLTHHWLLYILGILFSPPLKQFFPLNLEFLGASL